MWLWWPHVVHGASSLWRSTRVSLWNHTFHPLHSTDWRAWASYTFVRRWYASLHVFAGCWSPAHLPAVRKLCRGQWRLGVTRRNSSGWAQLNSWGKSLLTIKDLKLTSDQVAYVAFVINLGLHIDGELIMAHHVDYICRSGFFQLWQLRAIWSSLTVDCLMTLLHAFISSLLDYCSGLLFGVSNALSKRFQSVQNAAVRLVSDARKFDHISPVFRSLHWLPVSKRITYKLAMLVHKCLNGLMPSYLANVASWSERCLVAAISARLLPVNCLCHARTQSLESIAFLSVWSFHLKQSASCVTHFTHVPTNLWESA